jgi:hypothetical protein
MAGQDEQDKTQNILILPLYPEYPVYPCLVFFALAASLRGKIKSLVRSQT